MKYQKDLLVEENVAINEKSFLLKLKSDEPLPEILAGQFANILVENVSDRILRRPISIHDVDYLTNTISFVLQKIGKSTNKLSKIQKDERLNVVFPLGNSFPMNESNPLLVGGGVGTAPLYYLAKLYNGKSKRCSILIGAKNKEQLFLIDSYKNVADVYISTEDGSMGEIGIITKNSILNKDFSSIICCGPTPMMKSIAEIASKRHTKCYVSLENRMACGVGACLCCVQKTKSDGNQCVCTKGAVFDAEDIVW